ncbi:MAG: 4-(cytidine 5'-diphospho)-2-C-methyl-D-erythritol kinase [Candidatus Izemoplasmataceae bacterium]
MKEKAYAKINLFLDVLGKRLDHYHDLEMVMAPLALHDVLTFELLEEDKIELTESIKICDDPKENLVYKVAKFLKEQFSIPLGVKIHIEKNIPIAAGLAGGSADAAATLRGLNKLFKLKQSLEDLAKIGEIFGADIPYCIYNKLCIARGKGEDLFFLNKHLNLPVLIITPYIKVSTKEIFSIIKEEDIKPIKITNMTNAIYNKNKTLIYKELYNALMPFTFKLFPEVEKLSEMISAHNPEGFLMSGSGPSFFIFTKNKTNLKEIESHFKESNFTLITKIK